MTNFGSRHRRALGIAAAAVLTLATATACGSDDEGGESGDKIKVAVLTSGTVEDGSWGESVAQGSAAAEEEYDADVEVSDNLDTPQQFEQIASGFAQQGYDLVVIANGAAAEVTGRLAAQFPDTKFAGIAQNIPDLPENATTVTPIFQETAFLTGVVAGDVTKSNVVGTIGGFEFPVLNNEMEGFALGARFANPDVTVKRSFINTWTDAGKGRAAATAMMAQDVDLIFSATDQATQGMVQAMQTEPEHYVITQYADDAKSAPSVILTSALYGLDEITKGFVQDVVEDSWTSDNVVLGLAEVGHIAPYYELDNVVTDEAKAEVTAVEEAIKSGCLQIPDSAALADSGSADEIDVAALRAQFEAC